MASLKGLFNYKSTGFPFQEVEYQFETYRYYLQCFVKMMNTGYPKIDYLITDAAGKLAHLQGFKGYDAEWVSRFLKNGWNTEYILNFNLSSEPELARINNQWQPIQTYYAIYSVGEALAYLLDQHKAGTHKSCLKKLNYFLKGINIQPWNLMYTGKLGKSGKDHFHVNFPVGIVIPHNLARTGIEPIQMVCKCLKAEHPKRVDDDFQKKPGIYKYNFDPGLTSLLNFMYRMRIKSNYEEIDMFLAEAPDEVIIEFGKNLAFICLYTLTLFEIAIIRKIGKANFSKIVEEYLKINKSASAIEARNSLYKSLIK